MRIPVSTRAKTSNGILSGIGLAGGNLPIAYLIRNVQADTHLLISLLLRPASALCVCDSFPSSSTHLAALADRSSGCRLLGPIRCKQSTGLLELSNLGVNRSENFVYRHSKIKSKPLLTVPAQPRTSASRPQPILNFEGANATELPGIVGD